MITRDKDFGLARRLATFGFLISTLIPIFEIPESSLFSGFIEFLVVRIWRNFFHESHSKYLDV